MGPPWLVVRISLYRVFCRDLAERNPVDGRGSLWRAFRDSARIRRS